MSEVLAIALQAMHADTARVEQVGMNLANVLTPAYKRGIAVQHAVGVPFAQVFADAGSSGVIDRSAVVESRVDARVATLKATGQSLDLGLAGPGWFEVATAGGAAYTRQGNFQVDARGRLVTAKGDPVMGEGGEIVLGSKRPAISANGEVREAGAEPGSPVLARLRIVDVDPGVQPARLSDGYFSMASASVAPMSASQVQVRQGFLENSNVDAAQEMTALVGSMRHFETMQRVVHALDDSLGTAIHKLGEIS